MCTCVSVTRWVKHALTFLSVCLAGSKRCEGDSSQIKFFAERQRPSRSPSRRECRSFLRDHEWTFRKQIQQAFSFYRSLFISLCVCVFVWARAPALSRGLSRERKNASKRAQHFSGGLIGVPSFIRPVTCCLKYLVRLAGSVRIISEPFCRNNTVKRNPPKNAPVRSRAVCKPQPFISRLLFKSKLL